DYVFLLTMHHIVSDGWSMQVFARELAELYAAFAAGRPSPLAELPIQYADFALWQRERLEGEVLGRQLAYWQQQLAGLAGLELPTDRPRPPVASFRGDQLDVRLAPALVGGLKRLSAQAGTTLFMTLLAAFTTLLQRYTGQADIVVGAPIAGRNRAELEPLIGFFVNTLVLRIDQAGNPRFRQLLERVRAVTLAAYAHEEVPFEKLVEELQPVRDLSRNPLCQVAFQLFTAPPATLPASATPSTIAQMSRHYHTLLAAVVANPEQRLSDLPLLTSEERQRLLVEWNDTGSGYPQAVSVDTLFKRQVELNADRVAMVYGGEQLTYNELDRRANRLACYLRTRGIGPESLVGLCLDRSPAMVVAILGIVKAGGAYLPLDPSYPPERLAFMLEDSRAALVLTSWALKDRVAAVAKVDIINLEQVWSEIDIEPEETLAVQTGPDHLLYVMYTSGSTGVPKGIGIPHRAVIRLVCNTNYIALDESDRVAQASNSAFDAMTFELWGALLNGACLVGISQEVLLSPSELARTLRQYGITTLFLTTALFNQIAQTAGSAFKEMRHVLFGGEAVIPHWVAEVLTHGPPQRLLHVYGPTENTTFSTWYLVDEVPPGATTIPIGRSLANDAVYILDRHLNPVPVGIVGELYLSGPGLARGYFNHPALTAEKFLPNPYASEPGARMYRTGDLARFLPNGNVEFLGRTDHQVKLRGFRIELGEIEAVLGQHPAVQQAVVLLHQNIQGEKKLIAYVVPVKSSRPTVTDLYSHLQQRLPDYMIPGAFILLNELPLTPNGKLDRQALPAPDTIRPELVNAYEPPRNKVEETLATIWADLLGIERVGIYDNFFEIGGHSLLATQLVSRIENAFHVEIPLRTVFEASTVASLAQVLINMQRESRETDTVRIVPLENELTLQQIDQISDEEVEDQLRKLLEETGK
ncbi:MAG: non-ribosomal peptide synthetase, partial [Chloroflexi bacterium]